MRILRTVLVSVLMLAYPLLVYFGLAHFSPRALALLLAAVALLRALLKREKVWFVAAVGALLLAAIAAAANEATALKLYPVLVNAAMLALFGASLVHPPTVVERIARLTEPDLPPSGVAYTRRVTQVWCGFFVMNGSIALYTALYASDAQWALYNGLIAYVLMGLLFGIEWLVRQRVRSVPHG